MKNEFARQDWRKRLQSAFSEAEKSGQGWLTVADITSAVVIFEYRFGVETSGITQWLKRQGVKLERLARIKKTLGDQPSVTYVLKEKCYDPISSTIF